MNPGDRSEKIEALKHELAELRASMPAHSVPASLLMRIEDLEDELDRLCNNHSSMDEQQEKAE